MVKPKKHLGQHFLLDLGIAKKTADCLAVKSDLIIEIGPGTGVLTKFLYERYGSKLRLVEIDKESIHYLKSNSPYLAQQIIDKDFLRLNLNEFGLSSLSIIGNFPYNISSQIIFKMLENREFVVELAGMFQKEVAKRIAAEPGGKVYGILSVLCQAYYKVEYLFDVQPELFDPPPKVVSGVIRLERFRSRIPDCDEKFLFQLVKLAFNQRRKTLRNAIKSILPKELKSELLDLRAERLSADDFISLSQQIKEYGKPNTDQS